MNTTGVTTQERILVLLVLVGGVAAASPGGIRTTVAGASALWIFVLLIAVSYLRFAAAPIPPVTGRTMLGLATMIVLIGLLGFGAMLAPMSGETFDRRLRCVLLSPTVFTMSNLALYVVGFRFPTAVGTTAVSGGPAELLGFLGVHTSRASLPLTSGLNGAGAVATLSLVICVILAKRDRGRAEVFDCAGIACSMATVLLTDSRGPIVFGVIALTLMAGLRYLRRWIGLLPLLLPVAPAIILFVLGRLGAFAPALNRGVGTNTELVTATGRQVIWTNVISFLSHFNGALLYGWGAYGQVRSGVGYTYAYLFSGTLDPEFNSVHNVALQLVLDMGIVGLAAFLWLLMRAILGAFANYESRRTPESAALLGALLTLSLMGSDEAIPGPAAIYLLVTLVLAATAAIRLVPAAASSRERMQVVARASQPFLQQSRA